MGFWHGTAHHELTLAISRFNLIVNPNPCLEQPALSKENLNWLMLVILDCYCSVHAVSG